MTSPLLQDRMSPDAVKGLYNSLGGLVRDANATGIPHADAVKAIMAWAVEQAYASGGYPHARVVMLDVLETILLLDITKKNAA